MRRGINCNSRANSVRLDSDYIWGLAPGGTAVYHCDPFTATNLDIGYTHTSAVTTGFETSTNSARDVIEGTLWLDPKIRYYNNAANALVIVDGNPLPLTLPQLQAVLPCNANNAGRRASVTGVSKCTFGSTPAGKGKLIWPVICNGSKYVGG
jgi:hypothetical protein